MALFTQAAPQVTVADLMQQRATRQGNLQQQLMQQAAQGARDPMKAQMASFLGSTLGRALAGSLDDPQMDKAKAQEEQRSGLAQAAFEALKAKNPLAIRQVASAANKAGMTQDSISLLQQADALDAAMADSEAKEQKKLEDNLQASLKVEQEQTEEQRIQDLATQMSGQLQTFDPYLAATLGSGNANSSTITEGYTALREMREEKRDTSKDPSLHFNKVGEFEDSEGNMYSLSKSLNEVGEDVAIYTPIGNSPEYTNQKLTPLNTSGLSATQQVELAGEKELAVQIAKNFEANKQEARVSSPRDKIALSQVQRMLTLLDRIKTTGGIDDTIAKQITDVFGVTGADITEFENLAGSSMAAMLKSTFGANPTEGERAILMSLQAGMGKSKEANRRILERSVAILDYQINKSNKALTALGPKEFDDYLMNTPMPTWSPEETQEVLSWDQWKAKKL